MVETFNNFVDGAWKPSSSGATFGNENPAAIGSIQLITFSDIGTAFGSPVLALAPQ